MRDAFEFDFGSLIQDKKINELREEIVVSYFKEPKFVRRKNLEREKVDLDLLSDSDSLAVSVRILEDSEMWHLIYFQNLSFFQKKNQLNQHQKIIKKRASQKRRRKKSMD